MVESFPGNEPFGPAPCKSQLRNPEPEPRSVEPEIRNAQPHLQKNTPSTLKPKSVRNCTKPITRNPKPQTSNLKPETLRPQPLTPNQATGVRATARSSTATSAGTPTVSTRCLLSNPQPCRDTSLIRNTPLLGSFSRTIPRTLWWSWGGGFLPTSEVPLYTLTSAPRALHPQL